jgi:hypothetical protein
MAKTVEKVILSLLVVAIVGVSSVLVGALTSNPTSESSVSPVPTPSVRQVEVLAELEEEDDEDEDAEDFEEVDVPITGSALEQASQAALEVIGKGRVTDSEVGDEEGYYEIEITLDNGKEVDVHLDENFNYLSQEWD